MKQHLLPATFNRFPKKIAGILAAVFVVLFAGKPVQAQITLLQDYQNNVSAPIGIYQGINFREAGFSALYPIPNTGGKEYWTVSDRGPNIDDANANPAACRPTYDKMFPFPTYAPKIHRIRINGDSIQILQTITMKRPAGTNATGLMNPTGFGSTALEVVSTDTVLDCANFNAKTFPKDVWGIDSEGILVDKDGNFWICEEGGPTVWKLSPNGVVLKRYSPYANLAGAQPQDVAVDTVFKYRKNNRGFEGIAIAPNGKIYAFIQSPLLYPDATTGNTTRIHRILEINPVTNAMRMLVYVNDGVIGSGANQIRTQDWKLGDAAAINDSTFLVLEAAARGTTDIKRMYLININGATVVNSGLYSTKTLEGLVDSTGLTANNIKPVTKTLFMDLLANGWPGALDKAEGLAIVNDSTIAIGNDNDFGATSPAANGIATATTNKSHVLVYRLSGSNKLVNYKPLALDSGLTGISSTQTPYLQPVTPGVTFTSILTARDSINGYKMVGTPDGLGAFDNGNGTFTVLMNHELVPTVGAVRAHGSRGAFVSKWVINKSNLSVISGSDLIQSVRLWNPATSSYYSSTIAFNRFCSADLPPISSFYNNATGLGTQERIFMNGEESGAEGRAIGHIVTGPNAGISYELPYLGKFSWENSVASPTVSNKTVVAGMDDAGGGQVYFYVGTKTNTGTEIDKAGLSGGSLYGVAVAGYINESNGTIPAPGTRFTLIDHGQVHNTTGAQLQTFSVNNGVTGFLRPEDGAWDPINKRDFYFATTNAFGSPSRLWRLRFDNPTNPVAGGTIEAVLDGTEGQQMLDNITVDRYGHVLLVEDVGGNAHNGKVWQYTIATDQLKQLGRHDVSRFGDIGVAATSPFNNDEEASGILDVQEILGPGKFLVVDQAHYSTGIPSDIVEGGQFMMMFNPDTKASFDSLGAQSITSSQSPYLQPVAPGVTFTSIISANDSVGGYKMVGTPDGLGAFDNGNGTFTVLMNHELGNTSGAVRAHGSRGAFVSKWIVNKNNLSVVSGSDLIQSVRLWNPATSSYYTGTTAFGRFCSADLPPISSFYNNATGLGTQQRIFMNGEESGAEGRAIGHIVTGPNAGISYELPYLGKFSWENSVASPTVSNKTVVAGMDDATVGGQVYFYVGTKTNTGTEIDKAGLSGGKLFGVKVNGYISESNATLPAPGTRFSLYDLGTVQNTTGAALDAASMTAGVTNFLRPEDGAWDPVNKRDFYFATTNGFTSPSRLWRLRFDDPANPESGGTIEAVLDGTEGQRMLDNLTIDNYGHILLVEDVGGNAHNGKVWQYTIATDQFIQLGRHDVARFGDIGIAPTAPFNNDEEASGILDVQNVLGAGWFLVVDQAHYSTGIPSDIVEGGQFLAMYNPDTYNSSLACGAPTDRLYVDASLATSGSGSSWECGLKELREAVKIANTNPAIKSIWVADGTYYATTTRGAQDYMELTRADLRIIGGFSGNETMASQANPTLNPTIISGDIGTVNVNTDNSPLMLVIHDVPANASRLVIDGFIFERAFANLPGRDYGSAIISYNNTPSTPVQIRRSIFRNNTATNGAGAIYMDRSPLEFDSCRFTGNTSPTGGAIFSFQSSPVFRSCVFAANTAPNGNGGAYYGNYGLVRFIGCAFNGNTATVGGAVYQNALDVEYYNGVISNNTATQFAGGVYQFNGSNTLILQTTFFANAGASGGAITLGANGCRTTIWNSLFYRNTANGGDVAPNADILNTEGTNNIIRNTALQLNTQVPADNGSNYTNNIRTGVNPQFTNQASPIGVDGVWFTADDGLQIGNASPVKNIGANSLIGTSGDIMNNPRIACGTVDMGAYENQVCTALAAIAENKTTIAGAVANPFNNDLQIRYSGEEKANIQVTSVSGKIMAVTATAAKGITHVNATTWTSGIYNVEIVTNSGKKVNFKVIKL